MRWIAILFLIPLQLCAQSTFLHRLNWGGETSGVTGFKVYRSLNNGQWFLMVSTTNQTHTLTNTQSAYYKYRVTSYNAFGESLPSNEVGVDMRSPPSPTNLTLQVIIPVNATPPQNR